ncbi:TonB-dependent receptor [Rhizorhabdus argentea]|uniref:TonB-dependent receptor n=1 Tax=Rhizorhabdus argentea TaxID=1387174 RepID=UPI0030EC6C5F
MKHFQRPAVSLAVLLIGTAAGAQTPEAAATASAQADTGDIVVTASRYESLASKTPISLTAVSGASLRTANVTNPMRLAEIVPSLNIIRNDGLQVTLRGVSSADRTERGDPSIPILLDGVYIARRQFTEVSFFDIARVEVLRGPQGTLYGRNTTGGVVNVITNKPVLEFSAGGNLAYGNYDTMQADAFVNVPVSDKIAIRASGIFDKRDSYLIPAFDSPFTGKPFKKNIAGRLQALFNVSNDLSILLRTDYARLKGDPNDDVLTSNFFTSTRPYGGSPGAFASYAFADSSKNRRTVYAPRTQQGRSNNEFYGFEAEINWTLGDKVQLTYIPSRRVFNTDLALEANTSGTPTGNVPRTDFGHGIQDSHELRLATVDTGPLKVQVGGNYFHEKSDFNLCLQNLGVPYLCFARTPTIQTSYGIFGQATYSLTDSLRVTGGARYSHDEKKLTGGGTRLQQGQIYDPQTDSEFASRAHHSWSKITWRAGLDYDLDTRTLLYATVSTGYKAGSFNDGADGVTPDDQLYYKPEVLTSYEVGFKTRTADNTLRLQGSAFYYDYKDLQLTYIGTFQGVGASITTNAGKARIKGIELEGVAAPSPRNRLDFSVSLLDAKYVEYFPLGAGTQPSLKGYPLERSPKVTITAGYTYTLPLAGAGNVQFGVRTRMSASYNMLIPTAPVTFYVQPSFTKTDATVTYNAPDDRFYVQGFVSNTENTVTVNSVSTLNSSTVGDPRAYGIRVGFRI